MRIRVVDAFAERAFSGNPAAVCVLAAGEWPEADWMQAVAAEMKLSETAFVRPSGQADADWDLRWFTPAIEVDMCGHATLATAHVLAGDGLVSGKVRFSTRSGILTAALGERITLDFPISRTTEIDAPAGLAEALGAKPESVHSTGALTDVLVVLPDEAALRELTPDIGGLEVVNRRDHNRGTIVTAPAHDFDFVSRFFAPVAGIAEDPVCGSAHTALASYWAGRLGRNELVGYQASARGGVLRVTAAGDRVYLSGNAVTTLDGELLI
ncbi:PhzF family phenazine biosynthesis protein [Kribbella steppae]|uniref:PhzF family phenazine biosynthesis protein n=1 Tax=Kribbella steppae TaxID=2512223 RepID=A0A4R2GWT4_9ACTN|nr:PhzF family phenazine biosynthesis isomerase [Kribbella steppae]TCO15346.1 PhzF family phenazine biosynthesis protein [Kribbella steppae]